VGIGDDAGEHGIVIVDGFLILIVSFGQGVELGERQSPEFLIVESEAIMAESP
jgi:hypothetical protein